MDIDIEEAAKSEIRHGDNNMVDDGDLDLQ